MPRRLLPVLLLLLASAGVQALSTDSDQPINIEADQAEADDAKGITIYRGDVIMTQGSMRVEADTVTMHYDENRVLTKMVAIGKPAEFRQLPDGEKEYQHARARRMEYYTDRDVMVLIEQARVWQGGKQMTGNRIVYDTRQGRVKAQGDESGKERVKITIPQKKKCPQGESASGECQ